MFKSFWPSFQGFQETVERAWHYPLRNASPFHHLDWLLHNTAHFLQSWSDRTIDSTRQQLALAKEVLQQLEGDRDSRQLASHEESLWQFVKLKSLGLASLQRTVARQESRLLWLWEGDAATKFFHAHANTHRHKNFIRALEHEGRSVASKEGKAEVAFNYFDEMLGAASIAFHLYCPGTHQFASLRPNCLGCE
jgi:hypothetical protein